MPVISFFKKNWLIILIWFIGVFFRFYRQSDLLGFYYDQGRDANMAYDIIHFKNFPAIGPTTGIQGLYLGPFWFYLITPGYFIGGGDPVIAAYLISFLESLSIILLYFYLKKFVNQKTATLSAFFWSFSYYLIRSSRWFSNPSVIPLFVILIIILLTELVKNKKYHYLPIITFLLGLSLQLEAASAIFFFPSIFLLFLINAKKIKKIPLKSYLYSILSFFVLLLPQFAFDLKNNFFITRNLFAFLTGKINSTTGKSWGIPTYQFIVTRLNAYYEILFSKLDTNTTVISILFFLIFIIGLLFLYKKFSKNITFQISFFWLFIPLIILLFFQGNYGVLYDYYLTGFFIPFIILFSWSITILFPKIINYIFITIIILCFLKVNLPFTTNYLRAGVDGPEHISLGNIRQSLFSVCNQTTEYNLDIYVPPVISHNYNYLLNWYQSLHICNLPTKTSSNLYLIYEIDTQQPARFADWIASHNTKSKITETKHFGGITVEKRLTK